jgi:hypothetical protein
MPAPTTPPPRRSAPRRGQTLAAACWALAATLGPCAGFPSTLSAQTPAPAVPAPAPPAPAAPAPAAPAPAAPAPAAPATPPPEPLSIVEEEPEAILFLRDGQQFSGLLVEKTDERVVLRIAGIPATFKADAVDRVKVLPPIVERYAQLRAAIADDDADQLVKLIDWLIARRRFDLALREAEALLARKPDSTLAKRTRDDVARQVELHNQARARRLAQEKGADRTATPPASDTPPASTPAAPAATPPAQPFDPFPTLTPEQINTIKVYEIDLASPPRLDVPRETITKVLERFAGHPLIPMTKEGRDAVYRQPAAQTLDLFFRLRAREFYGEVKVLDQPEPMRLFRDDVHRQWLTNSCATTACHGGAEAGRLVLKNTRPGTDETVYTNFWIISQFKTADGSPLLDFERPERSVLLQMALPREDAAPPSARHPVVLRGPAPPAPSAPPVALDAWKPVFRRADDKRFAMAVSWLKAMYRPRPSYNLDYKPVRPFTPPPPSSTSTNDAGR